MSPSSNPIEQKSTKLIRKFRGISQYKNIADDTMDNATDLLNVMISGNGTIDKLRVPALLSDGAPLYSNIDTFFCFSQGNGTRQVIANAGRTIGYYQDPADKGLTGPWLFTSISTTPAYLGRMYYVESNNLLFMANGTQPIKWNGSIITYAGIPQPTAAPMIGVTVTYASLSRAGTTVTAGPGAAPADNVAGGYSSAQLPNLPVGSLIVVVGTGTAMDGNYVTGSAIGGNLGFTYQTASSGAIGAVSGTVTFFWSQIGDVSTIFNITAVGRANGVAYISFAVNNTILPREQFTVSGITAAVALSLNGTWICSSTNNGTNQVFFLQPGLPDFPNTAPGVGSVVVGGYSDTISAALYQFTYGDSVLGHEGPASPASIPVPLVTGLPTNMRAYLTIPTPPFGYGIDECFLYRLFDGGNIWVLVPGPGGPANPTDSGFPISFTAPNSFIVIGDAFDDTLLIASQQANYTNYPPPTDMKYMAKWQGRLFGAGMKSAPQDIVYSGYDQVLRGQPEQSWFPFNRIRLAIGARNIKGFGVLMNGVVAWDESNLMYMLQGTIQDVIVTAPVVQTAQLLEEPWQSGLASHTSVQSTPRGVIWMDADKTIKIWNGIFYGELIGPRDMSVNIYPLLKRITQSTLPLIQSAYFNWLDRDWYCLLIALDGSLTPTHILFFDLSAAGADNLGCWITDIQADSIGIKENADGSRHLIISSQGNMYELYTNSSQVSGQHLNPTATTATLPAFWESGYWQDNPHITKMFRYGRITTDQDGFKLITTVLNDESTRLRDTEPWSKDLPMSPGGRFATNRKGRRQKFMIVFPQADVDCSVQELYTTAIELAEI